MPFLGPLDLRHQPNGFYTLLAALPYEGARDRWCVPFGFHTDLTSVPRPFRWLFDVGGDYAGAAVLHDYLCRDPAPVNRCDADGIFRRVLREEGASLPRRWCMWAAVRASCGMQAATRRDWWQVLAVALLAGPFLLLALVVILPLAGLFRLAEWATAGTWPMKRADDR